MNRSFSYFVVLLALSIQGFYGFLSINLKKILSNSKTNNFALRSTWQEKFDKFVDIDTTCDARKDLANDLLKSFDQITSDVITAIIEKDIEKIAPKTLTYGRNLNEAKEFRKQLVTDIIPDLITNQIPKVIAETPKLAKKLTEVNPEKLIKQGESFVRDLTQDPSFLQSTVDEVRKEVKNIFKSIPEGLYTPPYTVLKSSTIYEIRKYDPYTVVSSPLGSSSSSSSSSSKESKDENDILSSGNSFNELADYLLNGENDKNEKFSMTTPVLMGDGKMEFILPNALTSSSAPKPKLDKLKVEDISGEIVAIKQFSGIPTEKEVARQRTLLEDALLNDGIVYDNLSFKTLTYNPPYTLPWLRRNEVSLKVDYKVFEDSTSTKEGDL